MKLICCSPVSHQHSKTPCEINILNMGVEEDIANLNITD